MVAAMLSLQWKKRSRWSEEMRESTPVRTAASRNRPLPVRWGFVSGRKLLSRRDLVPGLYGDPERPLKAEHIRVTNRLLLGVSVLFTLLGTLVLGLVAAAGGSLWL